MGKGEGRGLMPKISALPAISSLDDDDVFAVVEDGTLKQVTVAQLRSLLSGQALIEEVVVGAGGVASIDFQSIPSTYRHLRIEYVMRLEALSGEYIGMRFNNDSATNYVKANHFNGNTGTGGEADNNATHIVVGYSPGSSDNADAACTGVIDIPYYAQTDLRKGANGQFFSDLTNTDSNFYAMHFGGSWKSTAAINRVQIFRRGGATDIEQGSRFSLYGVF